MSHITVKCKIGRTGMSSAEAGEKQGDGEFGGASQNPQLLNRRLRHAQRSADLECNLNGDLASDGSTVGPISGLKPPVFDRLNGLPFQSEIGRASCWER